MLIGEYETKLTEKNRLALPKKLRDATKGKMILTRGYEGCLICVDEARWKQMLMLFDVEPILNLSVRDTRRFIVGSASELEMDSQGRFVLPQGLKQYASIKSDVVFIGLLDWVEVWSKESWDKKLKNLTESAGDIAERLLEIERRKNENKT